MLTHALDVDSVVRTIAEQTAAVGGRALRLFGGDELDILVMHPNVGLVALSINSTGTDLEDQSPFAGLNKQVHSLRLTLGLDATTPVGRVVLHTDASLLEPKVGIGGRTSISPLQLSDTPGSMWRQQRH